MKQKDIALISIVVFISVIVSVFASKAIFGSPKKRQVQVEVVQAISPDFPQTNSGLFVQGAYDPTPLINIGQNNNTNPFSGTGQ